MVDNFVVIQIIFSPFSAFYPFYPKKAYAETPYLRAFSRERKKSRKRYVLYMGLDWYLQKLQFYILACKMSGAFKKKSNKMKKFLRKAIKAFKKLTDSAFLTYGQAVTAAMANAITSFPNPNPSLKDINDELANYSGLLQTAKSRDKVQVSLKNDSRSLLETMLSSLTDFVNSLAAGNLSMLEETYMDLNKVPEPQKLKAPTGLTLSDGANSGEMIIRLTAVKGAYSYTYIYSNDPAMLDNTTVSVSATTTSYTFTGLTKGKTYYCRVAVVGTNKQMIYSNIINRICQ
jgi:hypothetical protein